MLKTGKYRSKKWGEVHSLFVYGRGMIGLNRMTSSYRLAVTDGCYVGAICEDNNLVQSMRSAAIQSDSVHVENSTLYAENRSANETNKVSLFCNNADFEPNLLLNGQLYIRCGEQMYTVTGQAVK